MEKTYLVAGAAAGWFAAAIVFSVIVGKVFAAGKGGDVANASTRVWEDCNVLGIHGGESGDYLVTLLPTSGYQATAHGIAESTVEMLDVVIDHTKVSDEVAVLSHAHATGQPVTVQDTRLTSRDGARFRRITLQRSGRKDVVFTTV